MMQTTPRRRSITSPGSSVTRRKSSVPSLPYLPHQQQQQPHHQQYSQRRRNSQQHHQQPHPDSLQAISESGKPTLELAAYASDEFVDAMRQAAAKKFSIVPSRQLPPHLRRMSEPAAAFGYGGVGGGGGRESRRHSVDSLVEGPSVAFLSKKTYFGSNDSGQLSSFAELDEDSLLPAGGGRGGESELERAAAASEAALTARTLFSRCSTERRGGQEASTPAPPASVRSQRQQMRRVSIDSAVHMH